MTDLTIDPELSGELLDDRQHLRVVSSNSAALAQVAGRACQGQVLLGTDAALRDGDFVIDMEDAPLVVEKLQNAAFRDLRATGTSPAVHADASVSLAHGVADSGRNPARITNASMIATRFAVRDAGRSAIDLFRDMIKSPH